MTRTIVIGGGIAGLATAALLAREGHAVTILERGPRVGGRAGTIERDGFRYDTGPSWYLMPGVFDHFFRLLGTSAAEQLDLRTLDPGYRLFTEPVHGEAAGVVTMPHGIDAVAKVFESLEPGSARTLRRYLDSSRHASSLAERFFLYNPFTRVRSLLHRDVIRALPRLVTLLTTSLQRFVHRRFRHPALRQALGYPAVFLGTDPRRAPAIYHLMSALDLDDGVQYPQGGFWQFVERLTDLARAQGVEIITDAEVTQILTVEHGGQRRAVGVQWRDDTGTERTSPAEVVVSAADLHHTETALVPPAARTYPERWWQKRESGPGGILVLLGVTGPLPELEHHSLFFTADWDANFDAIFGPSPRVPQPASLYVCKPSASDDTVAPAGCENRFVLIPVPADVSIGAGGIDGQGDPAIEAAADQAIDRIAQWAGIHDLRDRIITRETIGPADFARDYHSWRGGMLGPSHILRQSAFFRARNASRRVAGLYYAGATTTPGVGVPMCLISAELVLKHIRGDQSPGPLPTGVNGPTTPRRMSQHVDP